MKLRNLLFIVLAAIVFCNCQSYQPTSLTVASYNLRNANGSDSARGNGWGQRCDGNFLTIFAGTIWGEKPNFTGRFFEWRRPFDFSTR